MISNLDLLTVPDVLPGAGYEMTITWLGSFISSIIKGPCSNAVGTYYIFFMIIVVQLVKYLH